VTRIVDPGEQAVEAIADLLYDATQDGPLLRAEAYDTAAAVLAALEDVGWASKRATAEIVRELVELATSDGGVNPEWLTLIKDVHEGHYTPPEERQ
jgi:hypothetical protein